MTAPNPPQNPRWRPIVRHIRAIGAASTRVARAIHRRIAPAIGPLARASDVASNRIAAMYERIPLWSKRLAITFFLALIGLLLGGALGAHGTYEIGPFDVNMRLLPAAHGESRVEIPPLGALRVNTHKGPTALDAQVQRLNPHDAQQLLQDPTKIEQVSDDIVPQLTKAVVNLALKTAVIGFVTALLLGLIFFRHVGRALLTGFLALVILAGAFGFAWATFDPASIREPHYEGLLTNVPSVIGDAHTIADRFGKYQGDLVKLVTNMSRVYANLAKLPDYEPDPNTIRVLHVSDLHLNPVSFEVIGAIAKQFKAQVIVDTGDITDWGSEQENQYIADNYVNSISNLGVPYVYIRGNHDSQATADSIAKQPNATVLDNSITQVDGLTFAGVGDPRHSPDKSSGDTSKDETQVIAASKKLEKTAKAYDKQHPQSGVDVDMIHDPAGADVLKDTAPLILAGHIHKRRIRSLDDQTTLKVEGSTGARGLRGLYGKDKTSPLQMGMLYFDKETRTLRAYDEITVGGVGQSNIELQRTVVDQGK